MKYLLPLLLFCTLNAQVYVPIHHEPPADTSCVDTIEIVQNWKAAVAWGLFWGFIISWGKNKGKNNLSFTPYDPSKRPHN